MVHAPGFGRAASARLAGARAAVRTALFLLKVFPMLPSWPVDRLTARPAIERLRYPSHRGEVTGDLYRPPGPGPHPAVVVCLGAVPFEVNHPQVPRLGEALARSGFAALLYWSPAMRSFCLEPEDIEDIAAAFDRLLRHPAVDPTRCGLLGTCVGGAFALMAAAEASIRERVSFVLAYAPYYSIRTLARDVASATRLRDGRREPWAVDQLTRKVYVHSITSLLDPGEAERLRTACAGRDGRLDGCDTSSLSKEGRAAAHLLGALDVEQAEATLERLPAAMAARLRAISPVTYLEDIRAPLLVLCHDRDDGVIPVSESRRLRVALGGRAGVRYTEFTVFQHLDPTKGKPAPLPLLRELCRFYLAVYPVFRHAAARRREGSPPRAGAGQVRVSLRAGHRGRTPQRLRRSGSPSPPGGSAGW